MALKRLLPAVLLSALLSVSFGTVRTWAAVSWSHPDAAVFVATENLLSVVAVLIDQRAIGCDGTIDYYQKVYNGGNYAISELSYYSDWDWSGESVVPGWNGQQITPILGYSLGAGSGYPVGSAFSFDNISGTYGAGGSYEWHAGDNYASNWNNQTAIGGGFSPAWDVFNMAVGGWSYNYGSNSYDYGWDEHVIKDLKNKNFLHPDGVKYKDVVDTGLEVTTYRGLPRQKWSQSSWHSRAPNDRRYEFVKTRLFPLSPKCYMSTYGYWYANDGTYDYWYGVLTASPTKPANPGPFNPVVQLEKLAMKPSGQPPLAR
jgi:hypothetical protein